MDASLLIDPTVIDDQNQEIFQAVMRPENICRYFDTRNNLISLKDADGNPQTRIIHFKYPIAVRRDFYGRIVVDVIGPVLGGGSFGTANLIIGSWKKRLDKLEYEESRAGRIMKLGTSRLVTNKSKFKKDIEEEAYLTWLCPHTALRGVFFNRVNHVFEERKSAFSMRRFKGDTLSKLIIDDMERKNELSIDDRFQLTIKSMQQLEYQVHARNIVHRDVKPENIMAYQDDGNWLVNFIDFNLSRKLETNDGRIVGTKAFVAPDFVQGILDDKSDFYSLVMCIILLWRNPFSYDAETSDQIMDKRVENKWIVTLDMFADISLPDHFKNEITTLFYKILQVQRSQRPSLQECLKIISNIYLEFKLTQKPQQSHADIRLAHEIGYQLRYKLMELEKIKINRDGLVQLKNCLLAEIDKLPEDVLAVKEFIDCAGVQAFYHLQSKDDLRKQVEFIIEDFNSSLNETNALFKDLCNMYKTFGAKHELSANEMKDAKLLAEQIHYANKIPEKISMKLLTLDVVADQASRLLMRNTKLESARKHLQKRLPQEDGMISYLLRKMC